MITAEVQRKPDRERIFVRCASHRARMRLFNALGRKAQSYYSDYRDFPYGIYLVNANEVYTARAVKGVTKLRDAEKYQLRPCIEW